MTINPRKTIKVYIVVEYWGSENMNTFSTRFKPYIKDGEIDFSSFTLTLTHIWHDLTFNMFLVLIFPISLFTQTRLRFPFIIFVRWSDMKIKKMLQDNYEFKSIAFVILHYVMSITSLCILPFFLSISETVTIL